MSDAVLIKDSQYYPLGYLHDARQVSIFSNRALGNMSLSYGDTSRALANRDNFLRSLKIDYRALVCAKQIHACGIRYAEEQDKGKGALSYADAIENTDALITDKRNLPLAIFTADCLSVFFYDPVAPAVGLAHAGWQSSKDRIVAKTVQLMRDKFNTNPSRLYAAFGPAIRDCCYEVGEEFKEYFSCDLIERKSRYYLDLAGINKQQLLDSRINKENIIDPGICTSCRNEEFFSFRKEGKACGRTLSVVMLR